MHYCQKKTQEVLDGATGTVAQWAVAPVPVADGDVDQWYDGESLDSSYGGITTLMIEVAAGVGWWWWCWVGGVPFYI